MGVADDARSEESFQSADDEDYFDLPQDFAPGLDAGKQEAASAPPGFDGDGDGPLPPGLNEAEGAGVERWNLRRDGNREQLEPIWTRLSTDREHVKISKMFSYVLRHAAHKLDVRIRKDGFVRLREIMKLSNFKPYNLEELMAVVYFDEKERYTMVREFDGELLIRANQGHTMKVVEDDLLLETVTDSETIAECVHGTYLVHWPFIKRQGLSKVARNHIHLANGLPEDGKIRGMRSTAELFVYVDVPRAMDDGVVFLRSKNDVILTTGFDGWLPVKYFHKAVRIDYNTCEIEELEFDNDVDIPSWPAELAPSGPGDQGTYLIKNLEALISNCRKRLQEINDLKALGEAGQELTDEDQEKISKHAQAYTELQSLEQRFRQHKGFRRENPQEREMRAKEEAEAGTVVKRKDRAVTPPWERGKTTVESVGSKPTEKEKAEWEALGRRRDSAPTPSASRSEASRSESDPWAMLGRGRQQSETLERERDRDREEPRGSGGPPRFFNSKKGGSDAPSWRDRVGDTPSWRDRGAAPTPTEKAVEKEKSEKAEEKPSWRSQGSWREAMAEVRAEVAAQEAARAVPSAVPSQNPTLPLRAASGPQMLPSGLHPSAVPPSAVPMDRSYMQSSWQGASPAAYGMGQQMYYGAASPNQMAGSSWMGGYQDGSGSGYGGMDFRYGGGEASGYQPWAWSQGSGAGGSGYFQMPMSNSLQGSLVEGGASYQDDSWQTASALQTGGKASGKAGGRGGFGKDRGDNDGGEQDWAALGRMRAGA